MKEIGENSQYLTIFVSLLYLDARATINDFKVQMNVRGGLESGKIIISQIKHKEGNDISSILLSIDYSYNVMKFCKRTPLMSCMDCQDPILDLTSANLCLEGN